MKVDSDDKSMFSTQSPVCIIEQVHMMGVRTNNEYAFLISLFLSENSRELFANATFSLSPPICSATVARKAMAVVPPHPAYPINPPL